MLQCAGRTRSLLERADSVGSTVAGRWAEDVDGEGRFPVEAFDALCHRRVLGAVVPTESGGEGAGLIEACEIVRVLGRYCASTAMILAVHQAMVTAIVRHGRSEQTDRVLHDVAGDQLLVTGCFHAPVSGPARGKTMISRGTMLFGREADLVVARTPDRCEVRGRGPDRLVVARRADIALQREDHGDGIGLRGLGWDAYSMETTQGSGDMFEDTFDHVVVGTLAPVLELMACAVRVGVTDTAIDTAERYLDRCRGGDRSDTAALAGATAARDAVWIDICCRAAGIEMSPEVGGAGRAGADTVPSLDGAVMSAMGVCGLAGYRETGGFALGRQLRDVVGASGLVLAALGVDRAEVAGRIA